MTEQLFVQQLESPSGTGRVEPRSASSLSATDTNKRDANRQTHSHWQVWRDDRLDVQLPLHDEYVRIAIDDDVI